MPEFLSDDWFEAVVTAAADLPALDGVTFVFDLEVAESSLGKVRGHGTIVDGRLESFTPGKFVASDGAPAVDVHFGGKAKRLLPVLHGEVSPLVAYMRGELKVDGAYEWVIDRLAHAADRDALESFRAEVVAQTD